MARALLSGRSLKADRVLASARMLWASKTQNYVVHSDDLTAASWTLGTGVTRTGGQTDPFGGTTAILLNEGTSAAVAHSLLNSGGFFSSFRLDAYLRCSFYARDNTRQFVGMGGHFTSAAAPIWDLSTGTAVAALAGSVSATWSGSLQSNGWRRFSHVYPAPVSGAIFTTATFFLSDGLSSSLLYTGVGKSLYVAAPMVEIIPNAGYVPDPEPDEYVQTTTAVVTTTKRKRVRH
jgi:hypothetical protein